MTKRYWTDPHALEPSAEAGDEFTVEVKAAIDDLRTTYDLDSGDADFDDETVVADAETFASVLPAVERRGFEAQGAAAVFRLTAAGISNQKRLLVIVSKPKARRSVKVRGLAASCASMVRRLVSSRSRMMAVRLNWTGTQVTLVALAVCRCVVRRRCWICTTRIAARSHWFRDSRSSVGLDKQAGALLAGAGKIALVTGAIDGPANAALLKSVQETFAGKIEHVALDPYAKDQVIAARQTCFGAAVAPTYHFDQAHVLVSFGSDPLEGGHSSFAEERSLLETAQAAF